MALKPGVHSGSRTSGSEETQGIGIGRDCVGQPSELEDVREVCTVGCEGLSEVGTEFE
jgi:hypothetical protein